MLKLHDDKRIDLNNFVVLSPFEILQGELGFPQCVVNTWMSGEDCEFP